MTTLKQLHEAQRTPTRAGRRITQKSDIRSENDLDPEYHKEQIEAHKKAIASNPAWASLMLPKMQKQMEHHQKRYAELTK